MEKISMKKIVNSNRPGGRITKRLFDEICENFTMRFESSLDTLCSNSGQRFTERQAYGLLSQALCDGKTKPKFILTELPVVRKRARVGSTTGRVDFLVSVRELIVAIELKLVARGLVGNKKDGSVNLSRAWYAKGPKGHDSGVVNQLNSLNFGKGFFAALGEGGRLEPKKFPLLIVCYQRAHNETDANPLPDVEEALRKAHGGVLSNLGVEESNCPAYSRLHPIFPKARKSRMPGRAITIYGLGFFAGTPTFEGE